MAQIDLHTLIEVTPALNIQTISSDTTTAGIIIDTVDFNAAEFTLLSGAITTGVFTPLIEDGDDSGLSDAAPVDPSFLLGTIAGATFGVNDDNAAKKIGYVGKKRYVRLSIVTISSPSGVANGIISVTAVKGIPGIHDIDANT